MDEDTGVYQVHQQYPRARTLSDYEYYENILHFPIMLRFENYAEEVESFFDFHDIKYNKEQLRKKTNTTSHKHYSHYYKPDEVQEILKWCELDTQIMGYRFEKETS